jgi:hypothetical protein
MRPEVYDLIYLRPHIQVYLRPHIAKASCTGGARRGTATLDYLRLDYLRPQTLRPHILQTSYT